jgi:hypothetical protein
MLPRRALPIVQDCPLATAVLPVAAGIGWCEHCRLHVHDLSATTELEARLLVRANGPGQLCVAYRTRADGTIAFREQARQFAFSLAIGLLVACTGHAPIDVAPELPPPVPPPPAAVGLETPRTAVFGGRMPQLIRGDTDPFAGSVGEADEDVWGEVRRGDPTVPRATATPRSRRARRGPR